MSKLTQALETFKDTRGFVDKYLTGIDPVGAVTTVTGSVTGMAAAMAGLSAAFGVELPRNAILPFLVAAALGSFFSFLKIPKKPVQLAQEPAVQEATAALAEAQECMEEGSDAAKTAIEDRIGSDIKAGNTTTSPPTTNLPAPPPLPPVPSAPLPLVEISRDDPRLTVLEQYRAQVFDHPSLTDEQKRTFVNDYAKQLGLTLK